MSMDFAGKQEMLQRVSAAVREGQPDSVTASLREILCDLISNRKLDMPSGLIQPEADHYARRELHHDPELGYCVMAMCWGPGQATPVHDHCGMWCVEGVWQGQIEVTQYELHQRDDPHYRFERGSTVLAGPGSAGSLIPPHEYHVIRNPSDEHTAVSIHIYRGELSECNVYVPEDNDGWYRRESRTLGCD